jgi:SsrA-binding protein
MDKIKIITTNKKAYHDYFILETFEAGIVLKGTEVKSVKQGKINLKDSYAKIKDGEIFLFNAHISQYKHGNLFNHDPTRTRKLLLNRKEIDRIVGKVKEKGLTLVPLKVYLKKGLVKIELGLCKGKKIYDKREEIKRRDLEREMRYENKWK